MSEAKNEESSGVGAANGTLVPIVVMPRELTAKNGAKALLMGEFSQRIPVFCPDCADPIDKDDCVTCDGEGELFQNVNISWTNIKAIYAMAVKHLEIKCDHEFMYFGDQKKRRCYRCDKIEK